VPLLLGVVRDTGHVKRVVIRSMARADDLLDAIVYRPAVVKAFTWLPRWWLCDLAKLSMVLDDHWGVGYWDQAWKVPGQPCEACGRRASIHVFGGQADDDHSDEADEADEGRFLNDRVVHLCGWCHIEGPILTQDDLTRELAAAARDSVAWRWRWSRAADSAPVPISVDSRAPSLRR
jgi:hypothetical protein